MFEGKTVLVLSPHPDDAELAAGGTAAKLLEGKAKLFWATFSWCEESMPAGCDIKPEFAAAMKMIGVEKKNVSNFAFKVRKFPANRQEILEEMVRLRKDVSPDLVLAPASSDTHQDHETISKEAFRAFKGYCSMLGYEEPWNDRKSAVNFFSELKESHLEKKIALAGCYGSQKGRRSYATPEYLRSLAIVRGQMAGVKYAEAFEAVRIISKI